MSKLATNGELAEDGLRLMRVFVELKRPNDRLKVIELAEKLRADQPKLVTSMG